LKAKINRGQPLMMIDIVVVGVAKGLVQPKIDKPRDYKMKNRIPHERPRSMWHFRKNCILTIARWIVI